MLSIYLFLALSIIGGLGGTITFISSIIVYASDSAAYCDKTLTTCNISIINDGCYIALLGSNETCPYSNCTFHSDIKWISTECWWDTSIVISEQTCPTDKCNYDATEPESRDLWIGGLITAGASLCVFILACMCICAIIQSEIDPQGDIECVCCPQFDITHKPT